MEWMPCPDGLIGCAVAHGRSVSDTNSPWRTNVVIVRRLEITTIPELGVSKTNKNEWVSETHTPQKRIEVWDNAEAIVLPKSSDYNDWTFTWPTNMVFTNSYLSLTNVLFADSLTNGWIGSYTIKLDSIKSFKTNDGTLEIELK